MLQVQPTGSVPAETARIAHQVFPKGNRYLTLRDELGATLRISMRVNAGLS